MSVRARILAIRITELVQKNPEVTAALGISAALVPGRDHFNAIDKAAKPIVVSRIN